jgi:hypothetical protein
MTSHMRPDVAKWCILVIRFQNSRSVRSTRLPDSQLFVDSNA